MTELDQRRFFDLLGKQAQHVVEYADLFVIEAIGVVQKQVRYPPQRLHAAFRIALLDRGFKIVNERKFLHGGDIVPVQATGVNKIGLTIALGRDRSGHFVRRQEHAGSTAAA